jgi:hypothetical protein
VMIFMVFDCLAILQIRSQEARLFEKITECD